MDPGEMKKNVRRRYLALQPLFLLAFLSFVISDARAAGSGPPPCAGSLNVSRFRLLVQSPKGGTALPLQGINIIEPGEKLREGREGGKGERGEEGVGHPRP